MIYSIIQKSQLEGAKRLDAEYYQPEYLAIKNNLISFGCKSFGDFLGLLYRYPTFYNLQYYKQGVLILKGEDMTLDGFVQNQSQDFISQEDAKKFPMTILNEGDIIFSVRGLVGKVSIIDEKYRGSIISANLIRAKIIDFSPYALWVFLNSKYGVSQISRVKMITAQETIVADDIKGILIPKISRSQQSEIEEIAKRSLAIFRETEILYSQAENLLLKELKIDSTSVDDEIGFVVNLSEIKENNRCDAEYFQPKYKKISEHIKKNCGGMALGELVMIKKGIEPGAEEYLMSSDAASFAQCYGRPKEDMEEEMGKQFIRVSSLSKFGINDNNQKYLSEELYQKLKDNFEPEKGEILLTKDASPGIAYVLKENIEGIVAGGILRLKLKSPSTGSGHKIEVEDEYLALCINSIVGQVQAERDAGGSVIAHWRPEQVKNILIPILPKLIQQKISGLIRRSHESRKKAKELLEEAKTRVEKLIEQA